MEPKKIIPVVHHLDYRTSCSQGALVLSAGADGVFLISHGGKDEDLFAPAAALKEQFPDKLVGLNLLGHQALSALSQVRAAGLDMVWDDAPGVTSTQSNGSAQEIAHLLTTIASSLLFFGSVAFKYQPHEPSPGQAAVRARQLGMIPTTSGPGTGEPPSVAKIAAMHGALGNKAPLAIASGMTPENVGSFLPYLTHFLVATGVSLDDHHFTPNKLDAFIRAVRG